MPREIFCNSSSEEIGIALSNSACRQKLFRRDGPKFDVWRGLYYVDGKPVPDTSFQFKMRYPTEASRTSCMLLIVFCALVSILNGIRLSSGILIRAPNVSLAAGFFSDKWTIIKQVFCLIGLCHLLAILMTTSFMLITVNLVFTTTVVATIGTIFGAWITVENRTVVQMFTAARTGATLRKALIPISMCFVFVLPGFLLNSYLEKEVLNLLSSVPERAEINLPSAPLLKPVVRPPVWRDGFVRYVFGIPAVDIVRFDTAEKKLVFDQLPIWRASTVAVLKALFLISFLFLFSRFIRLAIGIVLRVATTIDGQEVKYRPR